jgi:hypothetical protein
VDVKTRIAYHTADASRLGLVTLEGLKSAGVPAEFLAGPPGSSSVSSASAGSGGDQSRSGWVLAG